MVAAFASENGWPAVGTETAGRLIPGSGFKVGLWLHACHAEAEYVTWHGHRFEGSGVKPDVEVPWKPNGLTSGDDNQIDAATDVRRDN